MSNSPQKKHLPVVTLLMDFFTNIKNFFIFALFIYIKFVPTPEKLLYILGASFIFLLGMLIPAFMKYRSFYYALAPDELMIESGVFNQKKLHLPYSRMQSIKQSQWFFMKPFHLASLKIETAGDSSGDAEVNLSAVPLDLIEELKKKKSEQEGSAVEKEQTVAPEKVESKTPLYQVGLGELSLFSLTDFSLFLPALLLIFSFSSRLPEFGLRFLKEFGTAIQGSFLIILFLIFLSIALFILVSFGKNLFSYYDFKVTRNKKSLTIEKGLFSRSEVVIPINKIQGLEIRQNLLRKVFHLESVKILLATGSDEESDSSLFLFPILKENKEKEAFDTLLPEWSFNRTSLNQDEHPYWRYFLRFPIVFGLIVIPSLQYFFWWGGLVAFIVFLYLLFTHLWSGKMQGFTFLKDNILAVTSLDGLTKVTSYLLKNKIQDLSFDTSYWRYQKGIGDYSFSLKSGDIEKTVILEHFPLKFKQEFKAWLLR